MAINIEPIYVDDVNRFTFDKYINNLSQSDIEMMQASAQDAYHHYEKMGSTISQMVQQHREDYVSDTALARAREVVTKVQEALGGNGDICELTKETLSNPSNIMKGYITSHPEVSKRIANKTLTPYSDYENIESVPNLRYKEATSGISTSDKKAVVLTTTKDTTITSKDKIALNKTYRTLLKHLDDVTFE